MSGNSQQNAKNGRLNKKLTLRTSPSILSAISLCEAMEFKLAFRVAYMR